MFSTAIIIFREVFEIVLIVGIILAATRDLAHRGKWISLGFGAGIAGSAMVAYFIDAISDFAEGLGQEIFNASILFVAAAFIAWTVLWMKRHSHEMRRHFAQIGEQISEGSAPFYALSAVIALAMLREGSEIVLFVNGMLVSGQSVSSIIMGALVGGGAGFVVGVLFYLGLVKISMKHFFGITGGLLMLLVAGMVSQGMGFLVAAGYFESWSNVVWDSSWLLSEQGVLGQTLQALIGYTARPTIVQLVAYAATIGALIMLVKRCDRAARTVMAAMVVTGVAAGAMMVPVEAQAAKRVYAPYVEEGELELELRGSYDVDDNSAKDGAQKHKISLGYGLTDKWFAEVYGEYEKSGVNGSDLDFTALEIENRFQLSEAGEHWLDYGLLVEYKMAMEDNEADKAEVILLLAKETGKFLHLANIILEKELGANSSDGTEAGISWGTRYRYSQMFEPGFEIHSDFGALQDSKPYDQQKHMVGPVAYGKIGSFKYDAGYLVGLSDAAPDGEFKWILEYEWHF